MATVAEGGIQGSAHVGMGGGIAEQGKEQMKRVTGATRERVYHQVDSKKGDLIEGLHGLVSTLENASRDSEGLSQQVIQHAVGYVRRFSDRIENGSTEELVADARQFIRQRPGAFFAGCLAVGFLAARLLKE